MPLQRGRALAAALLAVLAPLPAPAQTPRGRPLPGPLISRGDEFHARLMPQEALDAYEEAVVLAPWSGEALCKAAREALALGTLAEDAELRRSWFRRAEAYARRAVRVAPDDAEARFQLAAALGSLAVEAGAREKVALSVEILVHARRALRLDPLHAGAHHVYGRWHAEGMRLGRVARFLARSLFGAGALREASWEEAERHLRRAAELDPGGLAHHLELGKIYRDTGRPARAREEFRTVLALPVREPADPLHEQEAQELLKRLP